MLFGSPTRRPRPHARALLETLESRTLLSASLEAISNRSMPAGKTLLVPLNGATTDARALAYTVSSSNAAVTATLLTGNTWLKLETSMGDMLLQLFNNFAPTTVNTITGLVNQDFYDGLIFHRVIPSFMIQGGDPNGNGTGGPGFQFDDEFHRDAIFSGTGQLAMANSGADTNGSQFFITTTPSRFLDFNHTIFGQLVEGFDTLTAIANVPKDGNNKPTTPVTINNASIVANNTDAVLLLKASAAATSTITVTADDGNGSVAQRTFTATATADATNSPPFLAPLDNVITGVNTPLNLNIAYTDLENSPVNYGLGSIDPAKGTVDLVNGVLTFTPANNFVGTVDILVGIAQISDLQQGARGSRQDPLYDLQTFTVTVNAAPTGWVDVINGGWIMGWGHDKNAGASPVKIRVDVDGVAGTPFNASVTRNDLTAAIGSPNHGFQYTLPVMREGPHNVKVYVIDPQTNAAVLLKEATITSSNNLFDENYYMTIYSDVRSAVLSGALTSAWTHYNLYGQKEGRNPSPYFREADYLAANPDIAAAVASKALPSGFWHFYNWGQREARPGVPLFHETWYRQQYADIGNAVTAGAFKSAFEHFVMYGQYENRNPHAYFSASVYTANNGPIVQYLGSLPFRSAYEHFAIYGRFEGRKFANNYTESAYLANNPDIAAAVTAGTFRTGFEHFIRWGYKEGRKAT